jgi:D-alanyl-D-alanine carboxypeptidase
MKAMMRYNIGYQACPIVSFGMNILEKLVINFVLFSLLLVLVVVGSTRYVTLPMAERAILVLSGLSPVTAMEVVASTGEPQVIKPVLEEINIEPEVLLAEDNFIRPAVVAKNTLLATNQPFAEVNFPEMTINYYEGKKLVSTTPIKVAGDPQGWGGTPAGLYSVLSKSERAFSASAEAFMPQALHFYGKYFIHGEPYYPSGRKIDSAVSGGCVQVADEQATKVYQTLTPNLPVLVVDKNYDEYVYPTGRNYSLPKVTAGSFLVADLDSGEILVERDSEKILPIASITKLMTAMVVAEQVDLRRNITVTAGMVETGFGETAGLEEGGSYRVVELMHPLLIESSNDAAEALAGFLGRNKTISLMNEKANHLFMNDTHFADPAGFEKENISTARDLFILGRYILNNRRPILEITKGDSVTAFGPVRFKSSVMKNKNEFAKDKDFIGGKSGYLDIARNTGIYLFDIKVAGQDRQIAVVVLKSESLQKDARALKDWVEAKYL